MKKHNKKNVATMVRYLVKFKAPIFSAVLPTVIICAGQAGASLATAQLFQAVFDGNLTRMGWWVAVLVGIWFALMSTGAVRESTFPASPTM